MSVKSRFYEMSMIEADIVVILIFAVTVIGYSLFMAMQKKNRVSKNIRDEWSDGVYAKSNMPFWSGDKFRIRDIHSRFVINYVRKFVAVISDKKPLVTNVITPSGIESFNQRLFHI